MNTTANNTEPSMPLVITCMQVAGNTSKNGKNKTKSFKAKKTGEKQTKHPTQKTFKTLENEWKPRTTPVGAMEQANNTPRNRIKKKSQNAEKKQNK